MRLVFLVVVVFTFFENLCFSQEYAYQKDEVAVEGYDITSYFNNDLIKGNKEFQSVYQDVVYFFANQSNLNNFEVNPEKYMPAYGGWCAMALCQGKLVQPNPKLYSIIDDKLHLFEVKVFFNGKIQWLKNPEKNKKLADQEYKSAIAAKSN